MSESPPPNRVPPFIEYERPKPPPKPKGSLGLFVLGLLAGVVFSIPGWILGVMAGAGLVAVLSFVIVIKFALGIFVQHRTGSSSFLAGILCSIALSPLVGFGLLAAACGGAVRF